jgi:hypothetical protein
MGVGGGGGGGDVPNVPTKRPKTLVLHNVFKTFFDLNFPENALLIFNTFRNSRPPLHKLGLLFLLFFGPVRDQVLVQPILVLLEQLIESLLPSSINLVTM